VTAAGRRQQGSALVRLRQPVILAVSAARLIRQLPALPLLAGGLAAPIRLRPCPQSVAGVRASARPPCFSASAVLRPRLQADIRCAMPLS